jgi:uncharacterized protein YegJ (DUF2314 family)
MKFLKRWLDPDFDWNPPAAILLGLYFIYQAISRNRWLIEGYPRPSLLSAVCGLIFGIGVLLKMPGARWFGIPWLLFLLLSYTIDSTLDGWTLGRIGGVLVLLLMGASFAWLYFFNGPEQEEQAAEESEANEDESDRPFLSLVLLFREPPYLDADVLARLATKAWGIPIGTDGEGEERQGFAVGEAPTFILKHPHGFAMVHHFDEPYFDDPASVAAELPERRVQRAVAEHRAWTSVDLHVWSSDEPDEEAAAYRAIARLLAELADDNVLAVIDPAAQRVFAYDPETEQKLRGENPRNELRRAHHAPVISVPDDAPEMLAAVEEARRRWPEFVAAFEQRSPDAKSRFSVKAPLGLPGEEEFIWISVTSIEAEKIYGTLGNDPVAIPNLKQGDKVSVSVSKVNDWIYLRDDELCGGFTVKVVAEHSRRAREKRSGN